MSKSPELVAAISTAIAEDMGTDVSSIRIITLREVGGKKAPYTSRKGYKKYQLEDESK